MGIVVIIRYIHILRVFSGRSCGIGKSAGINIRLSEGVGRIVRPGFSHIKLAVIVGISGGVSRSRSRLRVGYHQARHRDVAHILYGNGIINFIARIGIRIGHDYPQIQCSGLYHRDIGNLRQGLGIIISVRY